MIQRIDFRRILCEANRSMEFTRQTRYNALMRQKLKNIYHLVVAICAATWFGYPAHKFTVIGVTGTDGKTTTANLIAHILKEAGEQVCIVSTIGAVINEKFLDTGLHFTTPSAWKVQQLFYNALRNNRFADKKEKNFMVLEVTSHALDQNRVYSVDFAIGVLTNVTHEHLDYHKSYKNYIRTKAKLLQRSKKAILNKDDDSFSLITQGRWQMENKSYTTYGIKNNADITPEKFPFKTNLFGQFNQYNALAAIAVCKALGIDDKKILTALLTFSPPKGRQEIVYEGGFTVMVDFAHTPNSFEVLLSSIKKERKGRLIHVFGSAGQRDKSKRGSMGEVSSRFSDMIVLTAEDPRKEKVQDIIDEIILGIRNSEFKVQDFDDETGNYLKKQPGKYIIKIPNRKKAIEFAISQAKKGDFVLLTGKGHEQSINYGRGEEPWDEKTVALAALKKIHAK